MTHRDSPSKLPWNNYGTQSDDLLLDCDDSDDENVIELKVGSKPFLNMYDTISYQKNILSFVLSK